MVCAKSINGNDGARKVLFGAGHEGMHLCVPARAKTAEGNVILQTMEKVCKNDATVLTFPARRPTDEMAEPNSWWMIVGGRRKRNAGPIAQFFTLLLHRLDESVHSAMCIPP